MSSGRYIPVTAFALTGLLASACGDAAGPDGSGRANILLVSDAVSASVQGHALRLSVAGDVPMSAIDAIDISISRIEVHRAGDGEETAGESSHGEGGRSSTGGGWIVVPLEIATPVDLLDLPATGGVPIAAGTLEAGRYNQVRLFFSDGMIQLGSDLSVSGGQTIDAGLHPILIPSAEQTGLKIQTAFDVADGGEADVVLEVGTAATVGTLVWNANGFQMSPVMKER